jgi:eukaryotic-like serine/threonine-protein kinase
VRFLYNRRSFVIRIGRLFVVGCFLAACAFGNFRDPQRNATLSVVPWPMEGAGPQRNRATNAQIAPPLSAQDKFVVGGDTKLGSPVAVTADMLFADGDHRLHAFGLADGQERWRVDLPGSFLSPAIIGDTVFVRAEAGDQGFLVALDRVTGAQRWQFQFPSVGSPYDNVGGHVTSPVIVDGLVVVGAARVLVALNAQSGAVVWQFDSAEPIASSATVADDTVYFADFTHLYALELKTGKERWHFAHAVVTLFFAPIVVNELVIAVDHDTIYALNRRDGQIVWQRNFAKREVIPAAATPAQIYVKSVNQLWALDAQSGAVIWNYATTSFISLPALTTAHLYIVTRSDSSSQLRTLQQSDGKELWRSENLQLSNSAPVITNGAVYVRTKNGGIVGYRSQ